MGFKNKKSLLALSCVLVIALLIPFFQAQAQLSAEGVFNWLIGGALKLILSISSLAMVFASEVLSWVTSENFIAWSYTGINSPNPIVTAGWGIIRDLCNAFFVVVLAFIGLATALQIGPLAKYRYEKLLPTLLFVALIINFTPVICGIFIDASNILMNFFLGRFSGLKRAVQEFIGLTAAIDKAFGSTDGLISKGPVALHILSAAGFNFLLALILALFAFLFIARYAFLWFLVIISPLAFFSLVLPDTRHYFKKWWGSFLQWCFIGVTAGFFLYLGDQILTQASGMVSAVPPEMGNLEANFQNFIQTIIPYGAALIFTWMGFTSALAGGAAGASIAISAAKWTAGIGKAGAAAAAGLAASGVRWGAKAVQHQVTDKARLGTKTGEFYQGMAKSSGKGIGKGAFAGWADASRSEKAGMVIGGISSLAGKRIARAGLRGRAEAQQRIEDGKNELKKTYGSDWKRAVDEAGMIPKVGSWDEKIQMAEYIRETGGDKGLKELNKKYPGFLGGAIKEMDKYSPALIAKYGPSLVAQKDKKAIEKIKEDKTLSEEQKNQAIAALPYTETAKLVQKNIAKEEDVEKLVKEGYGKAEAIVEAAFNQAVDSMKTSDLGDMPDEALKDSRILEAIARRKNPDFIKKIFEEKSSEVTQGLSSAFRGIGALRLKQVNPNVARRFSNDSVFQALAGNVPGLESKEDWNFLQGNGDYIEKIALMDTSQLEERKATLQAKSKELQDAGAELEALPDDQKDPIKLAEHEKKIKEFNEEWGKFNKAFDYRQQYRASMPKKTIGAPSTRPPTRSPRQGLGNAADNVAGAAVGVGATLAGAISQDRRGKSIPAIETFPRKYRPFAKKVLAMSEQEVNDKRKWYVDAIQRHEEASAGYRGKGKTKEARAQESQSIRLMEQKEMFEKATGYRRPGPPASAGMPPAPTPGPTPPSTPSGGPSRPSTVPTPPSAPPGEPSTPSAPTPSSPLIRPIGVPANFDSLSNNALTSHIERFENVINSGGKLSRDQMQFLEKAKQRLESATPNDNRLSELERIVIEMESNLQDNAGNNALYERAKEIAKKMRSGERSSVEGKAMSRLLNKAMDIKTGKTAKKAKKSRS